MPGMGWRGNQAVSTIRPGGGTGGSAFTPGGALDTSFDGDGKALTDIGGSDTAWGLAIQPDGKIVAAGQRSNGSTDNIALVRYHDAVRLYVQQDANFNVTAVTDSAGVVLERYVYEPYGSFTVLNADWSADEDGQSDYGQTHLHQGGRYDAVSGLYHFRNRDYSPSLGRWVQQDPMGYVDGMSLYEYVRSGPTGLVDWLGLATPHTYLVWEVNVYEQDDWYWDNYWDGERVENDPDRVYSTAILVEAHVDDCGDVVIDDLRTGEKNVDTMGGGYGYFDNTSSTPSETSFTFEGRKGKRIYWGVTAVEGASKWGEWIGGGVGGLVGIAAGGKVGAIVGSAGGPIGAVIGAGGGAKIGKGVGAVAGTAVGSAIGGWVEGGDFGARGLGAIVLSTDRALSLRYEFVNTVPFAPFGDDEIRVTEQTEANLGRPSNRYLWWSANAS